jgi:hypothetical protein
MNTIVKYIFLKIINVDPKKKFNSAICHLCGNVCLVSHPFSDG